MTIDWNEAADGLKREVSDHGGFLTISKDALKERFDIGALKVNNSEELRATLYEHGMIVFPHPYDAGPSLRVYDAESDIGKIALAVLDPQGVTERALVDAVNLNKRADAGKRRRSVCVPWLSALDIFLQLAIGRPPHGWEDLDDDREPYQLVAALAASLGLPANIVDAKETVRMAGAVWACRPRVPRWEGAPPALTAVLVEAARKQKYIFDGMLRDAAKFLLGEAEIPSCDVDLGRIGLHFRHEAQGGIG
jgi:hypothetical protein